MSFLTEDVRQGPWEGCPLGAVLGEADCMRILRVVGKKTQQDCEELCRKCASRREYVGCVFGRVDCSRTGAVAIFPSGHAKFNPEAVVPRRLHTAYRDDRSLEDLAILMLRVVPRSNVS